MKVMLKTLASAAVIAGLMGGTAMAAGAASTVPQVAPAAVDSLVLTGVKDKRAEVKAERREARGLKREERAAKRADHRAGIEAKRADRKAWVEGEKAERAEKKEERALARRAEFEQKRDLKLAKLDDRYQSLELKKLSAEDPVEVAEIERQQEQIAKVRDKLMTLKGPKRPGL